MSWRHLFVFASMLGLAVPAFAGEAVKRCLPKSDAEAIVVLNNNWPNNYWWDHSNITIAYNAPRTARPTEIDAINRAIATWSSVLNDCFGSRITLTNITGSQQGPARGADIVLQYVSGTRGIGFDGLTVCGHQQCPGVLIRSDEPAYYAASPADSARYIEWVTLHEIGHALGIGHPTNRDATTDLMGYAWTRDIPPVMSQCDIDAIAFVFAWVFDGTAPRPPGQGPFVCRR